jgi:anti-sigma regulatory factor (Ser/Thr protein kinase)
MLTFLPYDVDDMRLGRARVREIVDGLLAGAAAFASGDLVAASKITRQAAHRHLDAFVRGKILVREGAGRGARYRAGPAASPRLRYRRPGLSEDDVWKQSEERVARLRELPENANRILHYALTEIVNNAIDHSSARSVEVRFPPSARTFAFEVVDDGVGIFDHVRKKLKLPDRLAALQELSKGKVTTAPAKHSGEGLFFVSKIADYFEVVSGGLAWKIDSARGDSSVAAVPPARGTRVRFEVRPGKKTTLSDVFSEYTENLEFSKTRIVVRLFAVGVRFVSRSEAKRLLAGLERFREIVLDFAGVAEVGQGFADEVFRVWASSHRSIRLVPVNMAPTVRFMVLRARGRKA